MGNDRIAGIMIIQVNQSQGKKNKKILESVTKELKGNMTINE